MSKTITTEIKLDAEDLKKAVNYWVNNGVCFGGDVEITFARKDISDNKDGHGYAEYETTAKYKHVESID